MTQRSPHSHSRIKYFQDFVMGLAGPELFTNGATGLNLGSPRACVGEFCSSGERRRG
jgi:hypothetical protein